MSTQANFDINTVTAESLQQLQPQQMIQLVLALKEENQKLLQNAHEEVTKKYEERFVRLERELNLQQQYERRTCIEITGIPETVGKDELEDAVIDVLKAAKVKVHNKFPAHLDIQAAHRKGRKGNVICKFVNRKFAWTSLINSSKLKDVDVFENGGKVFINNSLCPEFGFLHFAVRQAKKGNRIHSYKVRHGVMYVKMTDDDNEREIEISHESDLVKHGLPVPPRNN